MKKVELKKGDYVLATKWHDGDPGDQYAVGFYDRQDGDRHFVLDNNGQQFRMNGFRRVAKISDKRGRFIISHMNNKDIDFCGRSLWYWKRCSMKGLNNGK